jgi:hypothetical protein
MREAQDSVSCREARVIDQDLLDFFYGLAGLIAAAEQLYRSPQARAKIFIDGTRAARDALDQRSTALDVPRSWIQLHRAPALHQGLLHLTKIEERVRPRHSHRSRLLCTGGSFEALQGGCRLLVGEQQQCCTVWDLPDLGPEIGCPVEQGDRSRNGRGRLRHLD